MVLSLLTSCAVVYGWVEKVKRTKEGPNDQRDTVGTVIMTQRRSVYEANDETSVMRPSLGQDLTQLLAYS